MKPRLCAVCPAPIVRRANEPRCQWDRRQCCSQECARELFRRRHAERLAAKPERRCKRVACGKVLVRREGEGPGRFNERTYCGPECQYPTAPEGHCHGCLQPKDHRPDERPDYFRLRKYCSSCTELLGMKRHTPAPDDLGYDLDITPAPLLAQRAQLSRYELENLCTWAVRAEVAALRRGEAG